MSDQEHGDLPHDPQLEALLRAAGRRTQPSAEQMARWRAQLESELRRRGVVRRRPRLATLAVSGALALIVGVTWLLGSEPRPAPLGPQVAQVVTVFGGVVVRRTNDLIPLRPGSGIASGARVESGLRSGLGVSYRGADLRLDAQTTVVFREHHIELLRGRVYLDTGEPESAGTMTVRVWTRLGQFVHVGTQFVVGVNGDEVIGAVREGSIVLDRDTGSVVLEAQPGRARMVVVDAAGESTLSDVAASGMLWSWALHSSAGLVLSGRSADEVLAWVAREQGLQLEYLDVAARRVALEHTLSGLGEPVGPAQALNLAIKAAGLEAHEVQGRLQVGVALRR